MRILVSLVLVSLIAALGCATSTQIISEPPGAKVVNSEGVELGSTPYAYESTAWLWETHKLELRKAGYANKTIEVRRSEIDVVPTIGSVALFICLGTVPVGLITGGLLFVAGGMKYPAETKVVLEAGGSTAPVPAPVPETPDAPVAPAPEETSALPAGLPIALNY